MYILILKRSIATTISVCALVLTLHAYMYILIYSIDSISYTLNLCINYLVSGKLLTLNCPVCQIWHIEPKF